MSTYPCCTCGTVITRNNIDFTQVNIIDALCDTCQQAIFGPTDDEDWTFNYLNACKCELNKEKIDWKKEGF